MKLLITKNDGVNWFLKSKFPAFLFSFYDPDVLPLYDGQLRSVEDALFLNGFEEGQDYEIKEG